MTLEQMLRRRLHEWRRMAMAYRAAQEDCPLDEEEHWLNKTSAEVLERCVDELAQALALTEAAG
jgi:hypothetical protein